MSSYPFGIDAVWLASDECGHVAAFTTGGEGPVPQMTLEQIQDGDLEELCMGLPRATECILALTEGRVDSWVGFAQRGLFAYDWQDVHRVKDRVYAYELIARPREPLSLPSLPVRLREVAERSRLPNAQFATSSTVDVQASLPCTTRDGCSVPQPAQNALGERQRLLAHLSRHGDHRWATAANAMLAQPEMQFDDRRKVEHFARAEYLLAVQQLRKRHAEKDGRRFEGLDELIETLGRLPPHTLLTGVLFTHGENIVRAFYGPLGELVGCLSGPKNPPLSKRIWRALVGPQSRE